MYSPALRAGEYTKTPRFGHSLRRGASPLPRVTIFRRKYLPRFFHF